MKTQNAPIVDIVPESAKKTEAMPVCKVEKLYKAFGDRTVLNGVDFHIGDGERVALMGPSGSGKSTLLSCLSGIDRPDEGRIQMGPLEITEATSGQLAEMRRTSVATVFQFFHLLPTLTAYENIELSLQLKGISKEERPSTVNELLDAVNLSDHRNDFPETLSGGERQRVAIARALAYRPRLILADEPTGSLDSHTGKAILSLLDHLTEEHGIAMLLVTHSAETAAICQRTIHIKDGKVY